MLINLSIIGAVLLFLLGVIYPLSFLPVSSGLPIRYSIRAFFPVLFSLKGFLLSSISIIFSRLLSPSGT